MTPEQIAELESQFAAVTAERDALRERLEKMQGVIHDLLDLDADDDPEVRRSVFAAARQSQEKTSE